MASYRAVPTSWAIGDFEIDARRKGSHAMAHLPSGGCLLSPCPESHQDPSMMFKFVTHGTAVNPLSVIAHCSGKALP